MLQIVAVDFRPPIGGSTRLGVSATEAQSLVRLVDSRFDCTTEWLLRDPA